MRYSEETWILQQKLKSYSIRVLNIVMIIVTILAVVSLIIEFSDTRLGPGFKKMLSVFDWVVIGIFIMEGFLRWGIEGFSIEYLRRNIAGFILIFSFVLMFLFIAIFMSLSGRERWFPVFVNLTIVRIYVFIVRLYIIGNPLFRAVDARRKAEKTRLAPAQLFVLSFAFMILLGTGFLILPVATKSGNISVIDALFTATSATCVTGLVVVDTGSYFTRFGQIVILFLIQIGGLGLMTVTTFFSLIIRRDISIGEMLVISDVMSFRSLSQLSRLIISIFLVTILFEGIGVLLLCLVWSGIGDFDHGSVLYYAIFHSISAFCNAGFSLFSNNLEGFRDSLPVNLIITSLIICGGIGFTVLNNLIQTFIYRRGRLSLHTKMALSVTAGLLFFGTVLILLTEWNNSLADLPLRSKILSSYFLSVTARTAGFNTINMSNLTYACCFLLLILMFIGASPGGTGGGVKTTTFGVFLANIWSILRGRDSVEIFKRSILPDNVKNSMTLIILSLMSLSFFGFILLLTQVGEPMSIFFELFSAFGTVGLSTGITPELTALGKLVLIAVMFIGRVGPLTFVVALKQQREAARFQYPEESIMIG